MGIPEPLELGTASLLHSIPHHNTEADQHEPTGPERPNNEVGDDEEFHFFAQGVGIGIGHSQPVKVDNMGQGMYDAPSHNCPCGGLVEGDVLVKRNDIAERGPSEERYEVTADGEENEDDIDVEDERS